VQIDAQEAGWPGGDPEAATPAHDPQAAWPSPVRPSITARLCYCVYVFLAPQPALPLGREPSLDLR
jgi:hypothetical protein